MKLASMRYKNFVWPHNPRVYSIEFERAMALNKIPFGRYVLQNLGLTRRVMRGEGEFQGANAYEQFKKLASVFYEETPGTLVHPLWDTTTAWLVELKLEQEPRPDYVKYSFTFWEEGPQSSAGPVMVSAQRSGEEKGGSRETAWHVVVKGETLWGIAADTGVTVEELIAWNPQIRNPNLIRTGEKVRVR